MTAVAGIRSLFQIVRFARTQIERINHKISATTWAQWPFPLFHQPLFDAGRVKDMYSKRCHFQHCTHTDKWNTHSGPFAALHRDLETISCRA